MESITYIRGYDNNYRKLIFLLTYSQNSLELINERICWRFEQVNNTKNLIKNPRKEEKKRFKINSKVWIVTATILVVALITSLLFDQFYKRTLITIEGDKYYQEDLAYYIYGIEAKYDSYDQMFGGQYWDMVVNQNTGETARDMAMQEAINSTLITEILYRDATSNGYSLTDDEKETVADNVTSLLEGQIPEAVLKKNNFTEDYLTNVLSKTTLVNRYRHDIIDELDIDDEGIRAGIDFEEYRQYDIEYIFISTESKDAEDKTVPMDDANKAIAYEKIEAMSQIAKDTEDWSTLIPEEEEQLTYRKRSFTEAESPFSDEFTAQVIELEKGSYSDILEDNLGYYYIHLIDNTSTESYDDAVEEAITAAENEGFAEAYNDIETNYYYVVNDKSLKRLIMGTITLAK